MPAGIITQTARGCSSLLTKSSQRRAAGRALTLELLDRLGVDVEDHALVSVAHQPAHDVGAHPAQTDHSQLHDKLLIFDDSRRLSST